MEINRIYNENCLITMAKMPDNFIDLTVTSPPYDNLRDYKGYDFQFEEIVKALFRVTKQGGIVIWIVGDATIKGSETGTSFKQALFFMATGFKLHDTMIYKRSAQITQKTRYCSDFEFMFVFVKGKIKTFNPIMEECKKHGGNLSGFRNKENNRKYKYVKRNKMKPVSNVFCYSRGNNHSSKDRIYKHPAIFPERLASDHIESWSNEGDLVYDPMGGSGTTIKMAYFLNRNYVMSEIASEYCLIAERRLHDSQRQNRLCFPPASVSKVL